MKIEQIEIRSGHLLAIAIILKTEIFDSIGHANLLRLGVLAIMPPLAIGNKRRWIGLEYNM
jgi:hypothetical protein